MRIPITMCHGISEDGDKPLTAGHFDRLIRIAAELGFSSISYDDLAAWRDGDGDLPERPIMFDFDHPVKSMRYEIKDVLDRYGYRGNLFIQTAPLVTEPVDDSRFMTWDEIRELRDHGWQIGAHTHTHPNLSKLSRTDPDGTLLLEELETNDSLLQQHLGERPRDFAFTGTSTSSIAARIVRQRYRFGRLWIIGSDYQVDGETVRFADLVGVEGEDLPDGGPPATARYITAETLAHRLPSMELQALIHQPNAFRAYLEDAIPS